MTAATAEHQRGSRKKTTWNAPEGHKVEITVRQKQIMELSDQLPTAQAVATKLGVTPNAVYVARRRVKDVIEASKVAIAPRRVVTLDQYRNEGSGINLESEVQEVATMIQGKLASLDEAENNLNQELEKIQRAKDGFNKMLSNVLDETVTA